MTTIHEIIRKEIEYLDYAISYAERYSLSPDSSGGRSIGLVEQQVSRNRESQKTAYNEFLRVAWGKEVRLSTSAQGEVVYRLTQSAAVIPNINLATPRSSVGKLVSIGYVGYSGESEKLGSFEIKDVRFFNRYSGPEFWSQRKNFKEITSEGETVFSIKDALNWLKNDKSKGEEEDAIAPAKSPADDVPDNTVREGEHLDDERIWRELISELESPEVEDEDEEADSTGLSEDEGMSLSARFYVNLSEKQYEIAHCGPSGLIYVFGVAGSGKTSVALGRAKSLAQQGQIGATEPDFNAHFPEDTQIGVVRTSEIIQYLKQTCNDLFLHRLPIVEYREIYEELKALWDIEQKYQSDGKKKRKCAKYMLAKEQYNDWYVTSGEWLSFVSNEMVKQIRVNLLSKLENRAEQNSDREENSHTEKLTKKVVRLARLQIEQASNLDEPDFFIARLEKTISGIDENLFGNADWLLVPVHDGYEWVVEPFENSMEVLKKNKSPIVIDDQVKHYQNDPLIAIPYSQKKSRLEWLPAGASIIEECSDTPISTRRDEGYGRLKIPNSWGQLKECDFALMPDDEIRHHLRANRGRLFKAVGDKNLIIRASSIWSCSKSKAAEREGNDAKSCAKLRRSVKNKFRNAIRGEIERSIRPADLYLDAVDTLCRERVGKVAKMADSKKKQLLSHRLTKSDIDVLLAFMARITRGMGDASNGISLMGTFVQPVRYRSSVFIDEVQDFTEVQGWVLTLLSDPKYNSVTIVGDPAQRLKGVPGDLENSMPAQIWNSGKTVTLEENIRQKHNCTLLAISSSFRSQFYSDVERVGNRVVREGSLSTGNFDCFKDQARAVYKQVSKLGDLESVVVVAPNKEWAQEVTDLIKPHLEERLHKNCEYSETIDLSKKYMVHVTTPQHIKGLEFDHVVIVGCHRYDFSVAEDVNAVYVLISRALQALTLIGSFQKMDSKFRSFVEEFRHVSERITL